MRGCSEGKKELRYEEAKRREEEARAPEERWEERILALLDAITKTFVIVDLFRG